MLSWHFVACTGVYNRFYSGFHF